MVQIGSVTIKGPAVLAPMAGTADRAFREICASFGAAYVISEMVSAKALTYGDKKSRELMELSSQERPFDILDLNMGCPHRRSHPTAAAAP